MICGKACKILGSQNSVAKDLSLPGCDTVGRVAIPKVFKECCAFSYNGGSPKEIPNSHVTFHRQKSMKQVTQIKVILK
jgi:hypothetical protein